MPAMKTVTLTWHQDLVFDGVGAGGVKIPIDGDNKAGPGPMEALLLALAACSGSDVAVVMKKKRLAMKRFTVTVEGDRREELPQRYTAIRLTYHIEGKDVTEQAARHAIDLSIEKYCSVMGSLHPDIAVSYALELAA